MANFVGSTRTRIQERDKAEESLFYLCKNVLDYSDMEEGFHGEVCEWFQKWPEINGKNARYRGTLLPRGHFKTTVGTVGSTIHEWLIDPQMNVLNVHYKLDQTMANLAEIKNHLEHNDYLRFIAPDICYKNPTKDSPLWLADRIMIKRPKYHRVPSFVAASQDASVVGLHFDLFKVDDLVVEESVTTDFQRAKAIEWLRSALGLRRNPQTARFDIIGTHWHPDDLYAWMLDPENGYEGNTSVFKVMGCFGNNPDTGKSYTGEEPEAAPIFSSRFTKDDLLATKKEMGSYKFACLMLNDPVTNDVITFQVDRINFFDRNQFLLDLANDQTGHDWQFFTVVDPNRKQEAQHDPGVVLTVGRNEKNEYWVVDCTYERFTVSSMIDCMRDHVQRWKSQWLGVEVVAGQIYLMEPLRVDMKEKKWDHVMVKEINRGPKDRKVHRVQRCQPIVEAGRLYLPDNRHPLYQELRVYGTAGRTHDHAIDALSDVIHLGHDPRPRIAPAKPVGRYDARRVLESHGKRFGAEVPERW